MSRHRVVLVPVLLFVSIVAAERIPLYVGGLLPSSPNPSVFSVYSAPAVRLAVEHINDDKDLLPDHELVLRLNDSQCNVGLALYQMDRLLTASNETKIAMLGEACSPVTQPLAATSQYWNIPQFNFLSGSNKLENRIAYSKYYHVRPIEDSLNQAKANLLASLNWRKSVLLVQSADLFTLNARDLQDEVTAVGLDLPDLKVLSDSNDFTETARSVKASDVRVIFGLFYEEIARQVICAFYQNGIHAPTYVWILFSWYHSRYWYTANNDAINCSKNEMKEALDGHFTLGSIQLRADTNTTIFAGKTVRDIALEFQKKADISAGTPISETFQKYSAYGYDVMLALARMLDMAVRNFTALGEIDRINNFTYEDGYVSQVFNTILEKDSFPFEGLTGRVVLYNLLTAKEKRLFGNVQIEYIQTNVVPDANDTDSQRGTLVGWFDNSNGKLTRGVGYDKVPWTTQDGDPPVDTPKVVIKLHGKGAFIAIAIIGSVCIILALILLLLIVAYRKHSVMQKSFSHLNELIVLGGLLVYIMAIIYGLDGQFFVFTNSSLALCYLRNLLLAFGFTFIFGSILVKTTTKLMKRSFGSKLSPDSLLLINGSLTFGFLLLIDCILFSLWYGFDPWEKGEQALSSTSSQTYRYVREKCTSKNHALWNSGLVVYKLIVMIVCIIAVSIRIKARGQKEHGTSDSPYIDISATGSSFGFAMAGFGFTFVQDPLMEFVLVSLTLISLISLVLTLLFYRKIHWIKRGREEVEERIDLDSDPMKDLAAAELKELRKRSRELRVALERVMRESPGINEAMNAEVNRILRNEQETDARECEFSIINRSAAPRNSDLQLDDQM